MLSIIDILAVSRVCALLINLFIYSVLFKQGSLFSAKRSALKNSPVYIQSKNREYNANIKLETYAIEALHTVAKQS